ncbi:NAD(P)-dependent oxidoreductase [Sphingomonas sp. PB4P5]|uniref:NAD(P)-dependent oxidoreductase n=1 Tax=Parasphingomonas puruogangriensis TaxID=3096155 RepID=UPI002FCB7D33
MTKIAFLGLGIMGGGMAGQLLDHGFDVAVWNRSPAKAAAFGARGARVASTPADAAAGADIVVAMVADDDASRACWLGPDGALGALAAGALAIESSTVTPDWIKELGTAAAAQGVDLLDAPVSGSKAQAEAGELRFLIGGEIATIERARPAFEAMGNLIVPMGPMGSGALIKLLNNFLCGVQVASLAEALALAERGGLDLAATASVLTEGAPGSPIVKLLSKRMIEHDYAPNFLPELMAKDLRYAGAALAARGIESRLAQAAQDRFLAAVAMNDGDSDMASVVEPIRALADEPAH